MPAMYCRVCHYGLWNLPEPRCPECGTAFDIRQYRFNPGAVAFACPHCGHLHGGAGPTHVPSLFEEALCLGCGQVMRVGALRVVPMTADLRRAEGTPLWGVPWEQRRAMGFWKAWWETAWKSMVKPHELGMGMHDGLRFGDAYWFAVLSYQAGAVANAVMGLILFLGMYLVMALVPGGPRGGLGASQIAVQVGMQLAGVVLAFVWPLLVYAVLGGAAHVALQWTGPMRGGFHLTAVTLLYGRGPEALAVVPCVGFYVAPIWSLVSCILMLKVSQQVSGGRAALAVLWLPGLLLLLSIVAVVVVILLVA